MALLLLQEMSMWSQSKMDFVLAAVMVGILLIGLYVMMRILLAARHTEPGEWESASEQV